MCCTKCAVCLRAGGWDIETDVGYVCPECHGVLALGKALTFRRYVLTQHLAGSTVHTAERTAPASSQL